MESGIMREYCVSHIMQIFKQTMKRHFINTIRQCYFHETLSSLFLDPSECI